MRSGFANAQGSRASRTYRRAGDAAGPCEAVCEVLADRDFQVQTDRLFWSQSSRPVQPIATRPRIFVGAGTTPASVQITVDRINDISDKEQPADMSPYNDRRQ